MTTSAFIPTTSTEELITGILWQVHESRRLGVEPCAAVTVLESDGNYCGALLCVYVAEASIRLDGTPMIGLVPQFYPQVVADTLQEREIIMEATTTRRTGISTTWCAFAEDIPSR